MNALTVIERKEIQSATYFNDDVVSRWLKFAAVAQKSVVTYSRAVKQMFAYFKDNNIENPVREDLEDWRDSLISAGKSPSTIRLYIGAAKLFFRFLSQENLYPNIADNLKTGVKISYGHKKDALSAQQGKKLLLSINGDSEKDLRDRAIIGLMLSAGLRTIEICRADIGDIRKINGDYFLYVLGKGRSEKSECVRLAPQVYALIQAYLNVRGKVEKDSPLFTSTAHRNSGQRLDTQTIRKTIKAKLRGIGIDDSHLTAHSLRHTAATTMLLAGVGLEQVQQVLRHRSINTTLVYAHNIERMKNTAECVSANAFF